MIIVMIQLQCASQTKLLNIPMKVQHYAIPSVLRQGYEKTYIK